MSKEKKSSETSLMPRWPVTHATTQLYHAPCRVGRAASKKYSSSRREVSNKMPSTKLEFINVYML